MPPITEGQRVIRNHLRRECPQPRDRRTRLVEQPHMGVTRGKKSIRGRENRHVLDRNPQPWNRLFETSAEEQGGTDQPRAPARLGTGAEPQSSTGMLNRQIRLPGPQPEKTA